MPIVNVATVPQRSPFRYPGGKTWLVPHIRRWLATMAVPPVAFVEPFAGGGSVSLAVAFEQLAPHVTLVERDPQVAAVWHTIIHGDAAWLAEQIATFTLTSASVAAVLDQPATTVEEQAFQTILKNRVNRGGILAPSAGRMKHGENGKGLASRWYPQTLKQRILAIASVRDHMAFVEGDGLAELRARAHQADAVCFIDPPYTAGGKRAGSRLYTHAALDHAELFRIAATLRGDFLMTYDNAEEIHALACQHNFDTHPVAMQTTHHAAMTELLIGRDLDWARAG